MTKVFTVREVAQIFSKHPNTIRAWAETGRLPVVRLGHELLFPREQILEIAEGRLPSAEISVGEAH